MPVAVTCQVLAFLKQAFSIWEDPCLRPRVGRDHLINAAGNAHCDEPVLRYQPIAAGSVGFTTFERRVW